MLATMLDLENFIPAKCFWCSAESCVEWSYLGRNRLIHPFYEQTLQHSRCQPNHRNLETSGDELFRYAEQHPGIPVRGLIFHISRCGSTLLAQMLAASPANIVASEAPPIDDILRATQLPREVRMRWLRAMLSAIAQPRTGTERACYLKLEPWHLMHFDLIREAFPESPWVFLYRDPVEVLVSHQRIPGSWLVPSLLAPEALNLIPSDWQPPYLETYWAQAIASLCRVALAHAHEPEGLLLNYSELSSAFATRLAPHFRIPAEGLPLMQAASHHDAKSPHKMHAPDSAAKQEAASELIRAAAAQYLRPLYEQLERYCCEGCERKISSNNKQAPTTMHESATLKSGQ